MAEAMAGDRREPLLARHVQARLPRLGPEPAAENLAFAERQWAFRVHLKSATPITARLPPSGMYRYAVIGGGGIGSAAAHWLSRRAGDDLVCLEQWELGHGQGASEDHRGSSGSAITARRTRR